MDFRDSGVLNQEQPGRGWINKSSNAVGPSYKLRQVVTTDRSLENKYVGMYNK